MGVPKITAAASLMLLCAAAAGHGEERPARAAPVPVQAPAAGQQPQGWTPVTPLPQLVYSPWAKFCGKGQDPNAKEVCFTGKEGRTETGQSVVAAAMIEPSDEPKKLFRIALPNQLLQLQFGTRLIIDQDPPISGASFTCSGNGCMADYEATPELVDRLKKGQMLRIQAVDLADNAVTFPLSLADSSGNSFQKANDGPPTYPMMHKDGGMPKKLQEDLLKRAEELRKRYEEQQKQQDGTK